MKIRRLRKVHQHSMFPVRWPAKLMKMYSGLVGHGTYKVVHGLPEAAVVIDGLDAYLRK
jgi:hypothetical protein